MIPPCDQCDRIVPETGVIQYDCPHCTATSEIELCPACALAMPVWFLTCWQCSQEWAIDIREHAAELNRPIPPPARNQHPALEALNVALMIILSPFLLPFLLLRWILRHVAIGIGFWF